MKTIVRYVLALTIIASMGLYSQNNGLVSGGLSATKNVITVKCKPASDYSGPSISNLVFTLRWPATPQYTGVVVSEITSSIAGLAKEGAAWVDRGYNYQQYSTAANTFITWSSGVEYSLGTISVTGGTSTGTFELAPSGTAINPATGGEGDWYIEIGGGDKTDHANEFYHGSVANVGLDVGLPVDNDGPVNGGIFALKNVLTVTCKAASDYSGTSTSNIVFAIRWPATIQYVGVGLSEITSSFAGLSKEGPAWLDGGYHYQQYSTAAPTAIVWSSGVEYTLGTISVSGGTTQGTFELAPKGTAINPATGGEGDWYFEIGGDDRTNYALEFYHASVSGVDLDAGLPVELTSFTAGAKARTVLLAWKTATETNNAGFEVQRKLAEGEWAKVQYVEGNGSSAVEHSYSIKDVVPNAARYLYRLKQIDRDGRFEYSKNIEVSTTLSSDDYALGTNFPNPFNPMTKFTFAVRNDERVAVKVFNTIGQEVAMLFDGMATGNKLYEMNFSGVGLASGPYFYMLKTQDRCEIKKMILLK